MFNPKGKESTIICKPELPGLTRGYIYDIRKAEKELNWKPKYTNLVDMFSDYKKEWESKKYHNYHYIKKGQEPASI